MFWIQTIKNIIETQRKLEKEISDQRHQIKKNELLILSFITCAINLEGGIKYNQLTKQEKKQPPKKRKQRNGGRKASLTKQKIYIDIVQSPGSTALQISKHLNLARSPVYKYLKELKQENRIIYKLGPKPKLPSRRRFRIYYPV